MSQDLTAFAGFANQLPAAFQPLMQQAQVNELSQGVGASFAVVSLKGKVFRIKFGGSEEPLVVDYNGSRIAAPYFDCVIINANANLSKTYYKSGFTEGSDESPTCWSEDGINPLAPMEQRPVIVVNGQSQYCHDCRLCPMNAFGSKVNDSTGQAGGKACADTRKLAVLPMKNLGVDAQGRPVEMMDEENVRFGGGSMLIRVPAASLKPVAEYANKLQQMGVPYYAVVTRLSFDQTVAYPKLVLTPVRMLSEAEAHAVLAQRDNPHTRSVLALDHAATAPVAALPAPSIAAVPAAAPIAAVQPVVQPVVQPAPATAVPVAPAPVVAAPVVAAPVQMPVTPAPVVAAPVQMPVTPAPAPVQPLQAAFGAPTAPAPVMAAPVAPAPVQPAPVVAAPVAAAPTAPAPAVSPNLLAQVDSLLDS